MSEDQQSNEIVAKRKRKSEMAGVGCLIQGIGLGLLFFFPYGTLIGVVLLIYGSTKSIYLVCSNCGNRLTDKNVKICSVCKAHLS